MVSLCVFLLLLSKICQVKAVDETSSVIQGSGVTTAEVGRKVTLTCFCQDDSVTFFSWYQQSLGGKPLIIATRMKQQKVPSISTAYKDKFQVESGDNINHLTISDVRLSDSATYYCGILQFNAIEFGQGTFLHVRASPSNIQAAIYQPALEPLWLGESVNLSCTVYTPKCAGELGIYWFRHHAAQPAIIYQSAGKCRTDSQSQTRTCTSNHIIKSVNPTNVGTYYCALASCGQIVFANGTKVMIAGGSMKGTHCMVYWLIVALAVSIILLLVLVFTLCKLKKQKCFVCKGTVCHLAAVDTVSHDADSFHYAAVSFNRPSGHHSQEESTACIYTQVKSRKE